MCLCTHINKYKITKTKCYISQTALSGDNNTCGYLLRLLKIFAHMFCDNNNICCVTKHACSCVKHNFSELDIAAY